MGWKISTSDVRRQNWLACFCFLLALPACSTVATVFGKKPAPADAAPLSAIPIAGPDSSFQWALQSFEGGNYLEALNRFEDLQAQDLSSPRQRAELAFYRGRCLYQLARFREAYGALESFVNANPLSDLTGNARLHMLLILNHLREWSKAAVLAAEAVGKDSNLGNLVLARLLWAEALIEQAEISGARKLLEELAVQLRNVPRESLVSDAVGEGATSLEDRHAWVASLLELKRCRFLPLNAIPKDRKGRIQKAQQWIGKRGECVQRGVDLALMEVPKLGPRWSQILVENIQEACQDFAGSSTILEKTGVFTSAQAEEVSRPQVRRVFYQLLNSLDNASKEALRLQKSDRTYRELGSKLDSILQRISVDASTSDRSL